VIEIAPALASDGPNASPLMGCGLRRCSAVSASYAKGSMKWLAEQKKSR
jgi:hypothetical protein